MGDRFVARLAQEDLIQMRDAHQWSDLADAGEGILTELGLKGFMMQMRAADSANRPQRHVLGSLPQSVLEQFNCANNDAGPVHRHVREQGIPLTWELDAVDGSTHLPVYQQLRQFGIHAGWSVAMRSQYSFGHIDIYSADCRDLSSLNSELLLFSCYLNDAACMLWERIYPKTPVPVLTAREKQCLQWSANGKTSIEIGTILGISQNTVYFHLKKAASKFGVYGTRHSISRAMEMGLI